MTDIQKEQVRAMRMQGIGYRVIAKSLGLKINQVQLFCKAHGLAGNAEIARMNYPLWCSRNGRCPVCGTKIKPPRTGRNKTFCSGRCRTKAYRMRKEIEHADSSFELNLHDDYCYDSHNLDQLGR